MFRFHKTLDVITLFHKSATPASLRVHTLLKQASAKASSHATEDQASSQDAATPPKRGDFELEVTEEPPTEDQFKSILEYLGGGAKVGSLITGAKDEADGLRKLKANPGSFQSPVVVDWSNARVVVGDNESEILKLVNALPKE